MKRRLIKLQATCNLLSLQRYFAALLDLWKDLVSFILHDLTLWAQVLEQVTYQSEGRWIDAQLLLSICQVSLGKIQNPELPMMHPTECKCTCEYYIKVLWYRDSIETFHFQCPNLVESCEISPLSVSLVWKEIWTALSSLIAICLLWLFTSFFAVVRCRWFSVESNVTGTWF